ncbi:MAG: acetyl-CoA carboxylase biotin carboxyl carrier protein [Halieaceae bacterium]|jgi:acetyl-CoA carboxylase biotin carboxyl carrier protein|nr:acetyl-CoA carboxylase biotin carboxyl carrier protein [Halieaceae bacterium]
MKDGTADEIRNLIQIFDESEWKELALQVDDFRIFLSRDPDSAGAPWQVSAPAAAGHPASSQAPAAQSAPAAAPASPAGAPREDAPAVQDNWVMVKAPNLGIFYRSPKPGAPPYVELGAEVDEETEICLIEVMKLFTPVHAGLRGTVRHICVEDGEMVDHDQPLFYIEPAT